MKKLPFVVGLIFLVCGITFYFIKKNKVLDPRKTVRYAGTWKPHWYEYLMPIKI